MLKIFTSLFYSIDENFFEELEETLIMADCGIRVATRITAELREIAKSKKLANPDDIRSELRRIIMGILNVPTKNIPTPKVCLVIGVNGVGKTTSIGKLADFYKSRKKRVMLAACDTFRAAAAEQLTIWAERAEVPIVKNLEATDPSSVVFDAVTSAKSRSIDVLLVDTAGRLHNKQGLMEELSKLKRTVEKAATSSNQILQADIDGPERDSINPQVDSTNPKKDIISQELETLLVLDASTGQNALAQAKAFGEVARIDGIILTKLDSTAKGGIILAIAEEQKIPVKYVGLGEGIEDFAEFNPEWFAKELV